MIRKHIFLMIFAGLYVSMQAQTFVSTTPSNRNVVLEEITGINCGYCPQGHKIAAQIEEKYPNRFFTVNIHAGVYAPVSRINYHTIDGDSVYSYFSSQVQGFPCGNINRKGISDRGMWLPQTQAVLSTPSCVNVAARGILDWGTRNLTISVEAYYTGNSHTNQNFLTVAMVQDNIVSEQSGGAGNPEQYIANTNEYVHMHMLRDFITPTWGDTIQTATSGSFFSKVYNYTIPPTINDINVLLQNVKFIVWISETSKGEIITGNEAEIAHHNIVELPASLVRLRENLIHSCDPENSLNVAIRAGSDTVTSVEFAYGVSGEVSNTFVWTGRTIPLLASDTVNLSSFPITPNTNQEITVQITKINGHEVTIPVKKTTTKKFIYDADGVMTFQLTTDRWASETSWKFIGPDKSILSKGGPYANLSSNKTTFREYKLTPLMRGCHRLEVYDSEGDGINGGYGAGFFELFNYNGDTVFFDNGKFESEAVYMIYVNDEKKTTINTDKIYQNEVKFFPNPSSEVIYFSTVEPIEQVEIFNSLGQSVLHNRSGAAMLYIGNLHNGIYLVRLTTKNGIAAMRLVKK